MGFSSIIDVPTESLTKPKKPKKRAGGLDLAKRGCKYCPLNKVPGIQKIKGTIKGREILVIAQSPGPQENDAGKELLGPAGKFFWKEMAAVGLARKDADVFHAVRCFPADATEGSYNTYLKMRSPTKEEIHCCSLYTEEQLAQSPAKQILILGKMAAQAFLKSRSVPTTKTFWSEEHKARVYLVDHPAFFVRGYGAGPRLEQFRQTLKRLKDDSVEAPEGAQPKDLSDQFAFIRAQDYRLVLTRDQAIEANTLIRSIAAKGKRVAVDIEDDVFTKAGHCLDCGAAESEEQKEHESRGCKCGGEFATKDHRKLIGIGFCSKPGQSFFFVFNHPEQPDELAAADVKNVATALLEDPEVEKAMHYGCSDTAKLRELESIRVRGFTHDTNLSEYLRFSDKKQYGLDALAESRFPQFSGYKQIIVPEMMEAHKKDLLTQGKTKLPAICTSTLGAQQNYISNHKLYSLLLCSLETLRLYNGGDADLTKRLEVSNRKHVSPELMKLYIDLSYVLYKMEPNGPLFDYEQCEKLALVYPHKAEKLKAELREELGDPNYNPGSPDQVLDAIYNRLGLEFPFDGKPNTQKMALLMLGRKHEFPKNQLEGRGVAKAGSTLKSYVRCADANGGRLRTRWWATGTRTGRLSSGGEKAKKNSTIINLQNVKKDPHVRNLCVADTAWKAVYEAIQTVVEAHPVIQEWWNTLAWEAKTAKKKKRKPRKLEPSERVLRALTQAALDIETWVQRHCPELHTYLVLDYGQVEVRVAAQMSGDKNLIADCMESDIHTRVGVSMTGWDADRIKNDEQTRTLTKNVHFGVLFGLSKGGLVKFVEAMSPADMRGKISEEQIFEAYDNYFARYPGVRAFIDDQRAFAAEHGYVATLFGMQQTLDVREDEGEEEDYLSEEEGGGHSSWRNQAINGPVQGTAHQLMICALVNLIRRRKKYKILGIPPMEVHDALYFRVKVLELLKAYRVAKYLLEQESLNTVASDFPHIDWKVPIVVDAKAGLRLGDAVHVDENTTIGGFMLDWYQKAKAQQEDLEQQLQECV